MGLFAERFGLRVPIDETTDLRLFTVIKNQLSALKLDTRMRGREIKMIHDTVERALSSTAEFMQIAGRAKFQAEELIGLDADKEVTYERMNYFLDHRIKRAKEKTHIPVSADNSKVYKKGQLVVFVRGRGPLLDRWNNGSQTFLVEDVQRQYPRGTANNLDGFDICIGRVEKVDPERDEIMLQYVPVFSLDYHENKAYVLEPKVSVNLRTFNKPQEAFITLPGQIVVQEHNILRSNFWPVVPNSSIYK